MQICIFLDESELKMYHAVTLKPQILAELQFLCTVIPLVGSEWFYLFHEFHVGTLFGVTDLNIR